MAFTQAELDTYWNGVKAKGQTDRKSAMDFSDEYKYTPGEATNLSTALEGVLDKDSA